MLDPHDMNPITKPNAPRQRKPIHVARPQLIGTKSLVWFGFSSQQNTNPKITTRIQHNLLPKT